MDHWENYDWEADEPQLPCLESEVDDGLWEAVYS